MKEALVVSITLLLVVSVTMLLVELMDMVRDEELVEVEEVAVAVGVLLVVELLGTVGYEETPVSVMELLVVLVDSVGDEEMEVTLTLVLVTVVFLVSVLGPTE